MHFRFQLITNVFFSKGYFTVAIYVWSLFPYRSHVMSELNELRLILVDRWFLGDSLNIIFIIYRQTIFSMLLLQPGQLHWWTVSLAYMSKRHECIFFRSTLNQNAYMHEQWTKGFAVCIVCTFWTCQPGLCQIVVSQIFFYRKKQPS